MPFLFSESSSASYSHSDTDIEIASTKRDTKKTSTQPINFNYFECVEVSLIKALDDMEFKMQFRMSQLMVNAITASFKRDTFHLRSPERQHASRDVYIFLLYMGSSIAKLSQIGFRFGLQEESVLEALVRISQWLISVKGSFIKWPNVRECSQKFERRRQIPGLLGIIGLATVRFRKSTEDEEYTQQEHQIRLQAIVDSDFKFLDIFCATGEHLTSNDVLRKSTFYLSARTNQNQLFIENTFLIGGPTYMGHTWLVTPFTGPEISQQQQRFNNILSSTNKVLERALGYLQSRFQRLRYFWELGDQHTLLEDLIRGCCVLHNLCIEYGEPFIDEVSDASAGSSIYDNSKSVYDENGNNRRREQVFNAMLNSRR